jgi:hypothetical protein
MGWKKVGGARSNLGGKHGIEILVRQRAVALLDLPLPPKPCGVLRGHRDRRVHRRPARRHQAAAASARRHHAGRGLTGRRRRGARAHGRFVPPRLFPRGRLADLRRALVPAVAARRRRVRAGRGGVPARGRFVAAARGGSVPPGGCRVRPSRRRGIRSSATASTCRFGLGIRVSGQG